MGNRRAWERSIGGNWEEVHQKEDLGRDKGIKTQSNSSKYVPKVTKGGVQP